MPGMLSPTASPPTSPVLTRSQARIVWSAMTAALGIAVVGSLAIQLPGPPPRELAGILLPVAAFLAVADAIAVRFVTASIRRKAGTHGGPASEAAPGVQTIVACALAVGPGLFACIGHLLTRDPVFLAIVLVPAALLVRWFPSEAHWARITPVVAAPGEPRRSSMIRE
jgi:hypothetical protein